MIRTMRPADTERVMQLWLEGNLDAHSFIPAEYWKANAPLVRRLLLQAEVYVYEEGGAIKGFAGMQGDYLAGIFVDCSARSAGIGKQLLDHIKARCARFSLKVYRQNSSAVRFYQREGLALAGESLDEETGQREYTMTWEAPLSGGPGPKGREEGRP